MAARAVLQEAVTLAGERCAAASQAESGSGGGGARTRENPRQGACLASKLLFCWLLPLFWRGLRRDLSAADLGAPLQPDLSGPLGDQLEKNWFREIEKTKGSKKPPSLLKAIARTFFWQYMPDGILILIQYICCRTFQPLLLAMLLGYFTKGGEAGGGSRRDAFMYAWGVVALSVANVFIQHHTTLRQQQLGMRVRIACCSLLYRKILRLSSTSLGKTTAGQVVNLMSNDVNRFDSVLKFLHVIWVGPIQILLCCYLYYQSVSAVAIIGVCSIILQTVPVQSYISRVSSKLRMKIAKKTDERVRLMDEIICGIQVIKMYAWEQPFEKSVSEARRKEMRYVNHTSVLRAINASFLIFTERTSLYFTLLAHVLLGLPPDAATVYSLAQFYNMLQTMLAYVYPNAVTASVECLVSVKRIQQFLLLDEKGVPAITETNFMPQTLHTPRSHKEGIENLSFEPQDEKFPQRHRGSCLQEGELAVELRAVTASWEAVQPGDPSQPGLVDFTASIRHGMLCAVIGSVGSGKSSLLHLLLKELPCEKGVLRVNGTLSYASQEPWLFVATIRNNILFGQDYDPKKYRDVVRVCALEMDFQQFPRGDQTLVGERGVSLSGGQRARINLARAVYRQADIYLLDDPLSGVDTPVGNHLFHSCIAEFLRSRTRVLVTHQLQYLKSADLIIIMENGKIENTGTYEELVRSGQDFTGLLNMNSTTKETQDEPDKLHLPSNSIREISRRISVASTIKSDFEEEEMAAQEEVAEVSAKGRMKASVFWKYWRAGRSPCLLVFMVIVVILGQLCASGADYWVTFWTNELSQEVIKLRQLRKLYLTAADGNLEATFGILNYELNLESNSTGNHHRGKHPWRSHHAKFSRSLNQTAHLHSPVEDQFSQNISSLMHNSTTSLVDNIPNLEKLLNLTSAPMTRKKQSFINDTINNITDYLALKKKPVNLYKKTGSLTTLEYLYIYSILIGMCITLTISGCILFFKACIMSSEGLHNQVFSKILRAKMRFFDTNPSGRILNRFSKDMGTIDESLPKDMMEALQITMFMASALIMVSITNHWLLIPAAVILTLFYFIINMYLSTAQDIKRLEGITRSPVFSHTCASIKGISTIRSSNSQIRQTEQFDTHQDLHTSAWYQFLASRSTLGFWLDIICIMFVACVTFTFIIFDDGTALSGNVGLAISQSLILTSMLQFGVRQATEVISHLTSVERMLQYSDVEQEKGLDTGESPTPKNWPSAGAVVFKHVFLSYSDTDRPVLEDLNVHIKSGWKVGIVGRTGAGKSSLISALFRLAKIEGSISIDGVEMNKIALQDIRSSISIIPQEPILFSSSMRYNLDPFEKYDDAMLWNALESVDLKSSVPSLDFQVWEGGSNFSVGQRQLVCLARAILRNNQILVLDEATANMDPQTDNFIQKIIREKFSHCTVLTIAHRLNTIMDADRVLVMEAGQASEFGPPHILLADHEGLLHRMVQETGAAMADALHAMARYSYLKRNDVASNKGIVNRDVKYSEKDDESISYGSMSDECEVST